MIDSGLPSTWRYVSVQCGLFILIVLDRTMEVLAQNTTISTYGSVSENVIVFTNSSALNTTVATSNMTDTQAVTGNEKEDNVFAIIFASSTVLIAVVVFIVVAYKFHVIQLNEKQQEFADQLMACNYPSPCLSRPPRRSDSQASSLLQTPTNQPRSDSDYVLCPTSSREDHVRAPGTPTFISPGSDGLDMHRVSICSSISDDEVFLSGSPRREKCNKSTSKV